MPKIIELRNRAIKIKKKGIEEMETFHRKHWLNSNDLLTLVLKNHLYIEQCIDDLFILILPNPKKISEKNFATKVDFLESLGLQLNTQIIEKIRALNKIRNDLAHNINYKITSNDLQLFIKGIKGIKSKTNTNKLKIGLKHIVGYLHALKSCYKLFPFTMTCASKNEIFKRETGYRFKKIYKLINPNDEVREILKNYLAI